MILPPETVSPELRAYGAALIRRGDIERRLAAVYGIWPNQPRWADVVPERMQEEYRQACAEVERTRSILRGEETP